MVVGGRVGRKGAENGAGAWESAGPRHADASSRRAIAARRPSAMPHGRRPRVRQMARLMPTCVWRASPELILALDERFGPPHDSYVNGSQVWLRDDGPGAVTLEWRLHPVSGYERPPALTTYEVFETVADALAAGADPPAPLDRLWEGLEAFAAYGDELEPATLATSASAALGRSPDAAGLVDHEGIADEWERTERRSSIVDALLRQLVTGAS